MRPGYCLQCGTSMQTGFIAGRQRPHCPACGFILFQNPMPVSLALVERDDELLLVLRSAPPLQGYWAPPTGYVELDESTEAAAIRETWEETAVEIVTQGLQGVYSQAGAGVLIIAYHARAIKGEARAGEDAADARFFTAADIPHQPPPPDGTALDDWFYEVVETVMTQWKEEHPI